MKISDFLVKYYYAFMFLVAIVTMFCIVSGFVALLVGGIPWGWLVYALALIFGEKPMDALEIKKFGGRLCDSW